MKRNVLVSMLCVFALMAGMLFATPTVAFAAEKKTAECEYGAPIIDGQEDIFWKFVQGTEGNLLADGQPGTTYMFKTAWTEAMFYYYVEVYDTSINYIATGGPDFYKCDSMDLMIDLVNDDKPGDPDVYVMGSTNRGYFSVTRSGSIGGAQGGLGPITNNAFTSEMEDGSGYIIEGGFPWPSGAGIAEGKVIGFDIQINDNIYGDTRDAIITWNVEDGLGFHVINKYGDLTLVNNGMFEEEKLEEATDGAPEGKDASVIGLNAATLNWEALEGASVYRVNLFRVVDDVNELVDTYEFTDGSTSYRVSALDIERSYIYQVKAYNDEGELLAVYPAVTFKTLDIGSETPTEPVQDDEEEPTNNATLPTNNENNVQKPDNQDGQNNSTALVVCIVILAVLVVVLAAALIVVSKKKKLEEKE